ncbi:MAG: glycosyltransferase [Casimicrobiaceae bacterium]
MPERALGAKTPESVATVDVVHVVIPVYNAVDDLAACVESVLAHTGSPYRLVVIDDASPDPAVGVYLEALGARALPQVEILRNDVNLGFTGTANRGMERSRADVVLLNSDTVVTRGWLEALQRCAATNPSFGTITPFSNNAEIVSFPDFCQDNPWPPGRDPETVRRALARAAVPTYPDLPTGVGFCMYIRRTLIDAVGTFDAGFGRGYGEENDFCLRGFAVGYRNVLCDDAFVLHLGGRSFQGEKAALGVRNLALLLERHPHYERMVQDYIAADPLRPLRELALALGRAHEDARPGVLHVIHGHGGGTEHHVRSLIDASRATYRHYLVVAMEETWQLEEHLDDRAVRTYEVARDAEESWQDFLHGICGSFAIALVHLHNISGARDGIVAALAVSPVPFGYTVHDVNFACPTITFLDRDGRYCGGETDPRRCATCLGGQPEFAGIDIVAWRAQHAALLARARFVLAPSRWAAEQLKRYFELPSTEVIPHGAPGVWALQDDPPLPRVARTANTPMAVLLPRDAIPTVAVLGAIGPDKGARRLEELVALAREARAPVRFVLIGYLDREHGPWQSADARLTIHGRYQAHDLPDLLEHYRVRLVIFPSAGPETFAFTLSEAWAAGRPVMVPPIGALGERVAGTDAGWVWTDAEWRSGQRMLDSILSRVAPEAGDALARTADAARRMAQSTLASMAQRTTMVYARTIAAEPLGVPLRPLAPARLRDALGYRLWYPPIPERVSTASGAPPREVASLTPLLRLLVRIRHTRMGRALRELAPSPLRAALRARLKS